MPPASQRFIFPASLENVSYQEIALNLPGNLAALEPGAFEGGNFETVNCPDGLVTICAGAFRNCRSLRIIRIPDGVTVIDESVFANCDHLLGFICDPDSATAAYAGEHGLIVIQDTE